MTMDRVAPEKDKIFRHRSSRLRPLPRGGRGNSGQSFDSFLSPDISTSMHYYYYSRYSTENGDRDRMGQVGDGTPNRKSCHAGHDDLPLRPQRKNTEAEEDVSLSHRQ